MTKNNERPICHRAEDLVAYLYNEASETDAQDFADHAEQCDACRSELAVFRQVHDSMMLWRNEALGATFSPASQAAMDFATAADSGRLVQHERKLSAFQALREFFSVSPRWLRGATAFAALLLCVLALVVISRSSRRPAQVANKEEKVYTKTQFEAAVDKAVTDKLRESRVTLPPTSNVASKEVEVKPSKQPSVTRRELARNASPTRSQRLRGFTRAEREQLAADLLLIPGRDEADLPFVFYEEPNQ